jgi:hypothetical protein
LFSRIKNGFNFNQIINLLASHYRVFWFDEKLANRNRALLLFFSTCLLNRQALGLKLKGQANFVASLLEVLSVDQGGQIEGDTFAQALLVAKTHLRAVVYFSTDPGILVKGVFTANAEIGLVLGSSPSKVDGSLEMLVYLLVDGSTKDLSVVHVGVENKVAAGVADGEVVLCQLRFARVEGHLVAAKPALMANNRGRVDRGAPHVEVDIGVHGAAVLLVFGLHLAVLGPRLGGEGGVKGQLCPYDRLVGEVDGGADLVVGRPFLCEGEAVLFHLVLGLQAAGNLARIGVGGSARVEFYSGRRLGLEVQLEQAEVVALSEYITGGLAKISIGWWGHVAVVVGVCDGGGII